MIKRSKRACDASRATTASGYEPMTMVALSHEEHMAYHSGDTTSHQYDFITVNMDIRYAQAMSDALDVFMRLGLGQVRELSQLVRVGFLPMKKMDRSLDQMDRALDDVDNAVKALATALGFLSGESYGLGNQGVSDKVHAAYELMKVVNKALAEHRNPRPEFKGVDYDGLSVRYTRLPTPKACILKSAGASAAGNPAKGNTTDAPIS